MGLFSSKEAYLGVDIGADGIKLVEVHKQKGRPQLWTYGVSHKKMDIHLKKLTEDSLDVSTSPMPSTLGAVPMMKKESTSLSLSLSDPRIEEYARTLKDLLKQSKVTTKRVTASLPVSYIFHTVITLPPVPEKEVTHHIEAKIKKLISLPLEEVDLISQKLPLSKEEEKKYLKYLVTAAPRELITFYTAIFQKAGLQVEELETEAFALERSLVGKDTATAMVVDMGSERTNFFIIDQGIPVTQRSIQVAGDAITTLIADYMGVEDTIAKQVKHDIKYMDTSHIDPAIFSSVLEPIVKEINYSFDLYLHQTGNEKKRPEKIVLTGGASVFPVIADYLREMTGINVFVGDPWARVVYQQGLKPVLDDLGPKMSVSIGLAMRNIV